MLFCMTGELTPQAARDMITNPIDSEEMAKTVAKALGGHLHSWYATVGGVQGVMAIFELRPDSSARFGPVPIALSATASSIFQNVQVRRLLTSQEMMASAHQAQDALAAYGAFR
jgi:hypothetical protein